MKCPRKIAALVLVAIACVSCDGQSASPVVSTGGSVGRGELLIGRFGCGSCHSIPGIRSANGLVGPPLTRFARRTYIAGEMPNTPSNLVRWLVDPPAVEPKTAMPALGLSEQDARDIAAYLYTLT